MRWKIRMALKRKRWSKQLKDCRCDFPGKRESRKRQLDSEVVTSYIFLDSLKVVGVGTARVITVTRFESPNRDSSDFFSIRYQENIYTPSRHINSGRGTDVIQHKFAQLCVLSAIPVHTHFFFLSFFLHIHTR